MTALAVALVLCCAMVCGTVLHLRRLTRRNVDVSALEVRVEALVLAGRSQAADIDTLRSELATLKARDALRGM